MTCRTSMSSCYAMLCYAMLCYAMLCYAMLCYAMLCYAMLCYEKMHYKHWSSMLCRSDLTLVCSPLELSLLQSLYRIPSHKLCNAPFFTEARSEPQHESTRTHFMTIGNWKHPPNRDGVQWLCQSIWPAIRRQLPHAELHIYGAHMSGAAQQHHKPVSHAQTCPVSGVSLHCPILDLQILRLFLLALSVCTHTVNSLSAMYKHIVDELHQPFMCLSSCCMVALHTYHGG